MRPIRVRRGLYAATAAIVGATLIAPVTPAAVAAPATGEHAIVVPALPDATGSEPAAKATKKNAVPGKYKGNLYTSDGDKKESFTFRVTKQGNKIKGFYATISVICSYFPPTVEVHPLSYPSTKIKKGGKFKKVWKPEDEAKIVLRGKFKGKKLVKGYLDYQVGVCVRGGHLKAKRVGK